MRRAAIPVGDNATSRLDHRDRGLYVIGVQPGFDHQVDLARSQQRVCITVHAITCQLRTPGHVVKTVLFSGCAHFRKGGEHNRLFQTRRVTRGQVGPPPRPLHIGTSPGPDEPFTDIGLIDHAQDRAFGLGQCNQHTPGRRTGDEAARAVNRVQNPDPPACTLNIFEFLAQNAVLWTMFRQQRTHCGLTGTICGCHRIETGFQLVLGSQSTFAKIRQDGRARGVGQQMGDVEVRERGGGH